MTKPTVRTVHFNGREFHRGVHFANGDTRLVPHVKAVILAWAITEHVRPGVFRGTLIGRREI